MWFLMPPSDAPLCLACEEHPALFPTVAPLDPGFEGFKSETTPALCYTCDVRACSDADRGLVQIETWLGSPEALAQEAMARADREHLYEPFNWQIDDNLFGEAA